MMLMDRRRALMGKNAGGGLPGAYQQVEFVGVGNGGNCYIPTNFTPKQGLRYALSIRISAYNAGADYFVYGAKGGDYFEPYRWRDTNGQVALYGRCYDKRLNQSLTYQTYITITDFISIDFSASGFSIAGNTLALGTPTAEWNPTTLYIFAQNNYGTPQYYSKNIDIAEYKIFDGTTLAMNLIPCYRKSDMEIGFYDTVSKTFLTNSGAGTLIKGADVA